MNFYSFDDIKSANCCLRFAKEVLTGLGYEIRGDRIQAKWRGGEGFNVAVSPEGWYDHKAKDGGSVISLCALAKFGGDTPENIQLSQDFLGSWLGLAPKIQEHRPAFDHRESPRYKELVAGGYAETRHYDYTDAQGRVCFTVYRLEHPNPAPSQKRKDFVQCSPYAPSIKDAERHLYNLPAIAKSDWAVVCEGEKDAETLIRWGVPATTCNNGSANWRDEYTEELRGKDVVICRDNDDAGIAHARTVARALAKAAKSLRVVCPWPEYSPTHGGDVTDWAEKRGGNAQKFQSLVSSAAPLTTEDPLFSDEGYAVAAARKANERAFANFRWEEVVKRGKAEKVRVPVRISDLVADLGVRFLGFPRRLGETVLFDHDRDTNEIKTFDTRHDLFSWISDKSGHNYEWFTGSGFVTREELYSSVIRRSRRYEQTSPVPTFPERVDVYYTFRDEMKPTPGHSALEGFTSFFAPADDASALLLRCFAAAPLYFRAGIPRPCWIIDSDDAWAVGKTTLVNMIAELYRNVPVCVDFSKQNFDDRDVMQRLLSKTGRNARMFLLDNLRGVFDHPFFASLVTMPSLSGRPPYGTGEETRPNDLTYVITSNSARIGTDIATRSFFVFLRAHPERPNWESSLMAYIAKNRFAIFADMIDVMKSVRPPENLRTYTRFPVFEREVVYPMCGGEEGYRTAIKKLFSVRDEANADNDRIVQVGEIVRENIGKAVDSVSDPDYACVFIRNEVMDLWLSPLKMNTQDVRNLVKTRQLRDFSRTVRRYPRSNKQTTLSGILFIGSKVRPTPVVQVYRLRLDADRRKAVAYGDYPVDDTQLGAEIAKLRAEEEAAAAKSSAPALPEPGVIDVPVESQPSTVPAEF